LNTAGSRDVLCALMCYLLGAVPFSYVIAHWRARINIYEHGEGNVGACNVYHVVGPGWGALLILVPARNEERNTGRCLQSLLTQDYPLLEVLVLDDGSTDATPGIVAEMAQADPRLRLVRGRALPQGWMGKNYACHQLAQLAQGEWLLFTDADTHHRPGVLEWAIEAAQQNQADLVSLVPHVVTHSLGEERRRCRWPC